MIVKLVIVMSSGLFEIQEKYKIQQSEDKRIRENRSPPSYPDRKSLKGKLLMSMVQSKSFSDNLENFLREQ